MGKRNGRSHKGPERRNTDGCLSDARLTQNINIQVSFMALQIQLQGKAKTESHIKMASKVLGRLQTIGLGHERDFPWLAIASCSHVLYHKSQWICLKRIKWLIHNVRQRQRLGPSCRLFTFLEALSSETETDDLREEQMTSGRTHRLFSRRKKYSQRVSWLAITVASPFSWFFKRDSVCCGFVAPDADARISGRQERERSGWEASQKDLPSWNPGLFCDGFTIQLQQFFFGGQSRFAFCIFRWHCCKQMLQMSPASTKRNATFNKTSGWMTWTRKMNQSSGAGNFFRNTHRYSSDYVCLLSPDWNTLTAKFCASLSRKATQ